jgi:excisionase family DNA binding protein
MKKTSATVPQLLSVREVASRFGVSGKTISRWIHAGDLRAHRLGRQIRISEEDLRSFVAARRG